MKTFFVADPHLGHSNIIKYARRTWVFDGSYSPLDARPEVAAAIRDCPEDDFKSLELPPDSASIMDFIILKKINDKTRSERLILIGDVLFANSKNQLKKRLREFRDSLTAKEVHLVVGNHDAHPPYVGDCGDGRPQERDDYRSILGDYFDTVNDSLVAYCDDGIKVFCSHYPMLAWLDSGKRGLPGEKRHKTVAIHAHGHVHGLYNRTNPVSGELAWAAKDVGVDASSQWPWSSQELWNACLPQIDKIRAGRP